MKQILTKLLVNEKSVTPFVGVWIETRPLLPGTYLAVVTPFVGVWIETYKLLLKEK